MAELILIRILQILLAPAYNRDVLWLIAPLVFGLIMIQMYFGKYKTEQLGWNTAYSNTVSLMWVTFLLFRFLEDVYGLDTAWVIVPGHILLVSSVGLLTLLLAYFNYQHALPKGFAFWLSNATPTSILAYLTIVVVMGGIPVDRYTLAAGVILYLIVDLIFRVYRQSITSPYHVRRRYEEKQKKRKKQVKKVKRKLKKKIKSVVSKG